MNFSGKCREKVMKGCRNRKNTLSLTERVCTSAWPEGCGKSYTILAKEGEKKIFPKISGSLKTKIFFFLKKC